MPDRSYAPSLAIESSVDEETLEWYTMTPAERWAESMRLWETRRSGVEPRRRFHDPRLA